MIYTRFLVQFLALMYLVLLISAAGCSRDEQSAATTGGDTPPIIPTVTAPDDLSGIWEGTLAADLETYDVALVFYMPAGASEGRVMGIAVDQLSEQPYILIDAGYQKDANNNFSYDYLVGKDGSQGTFMKFFEFAKNLVGARRGSMTLNKSANTLTGATTLEDLGDFDTNLLYSLQNAKNPDLADLTGTWSDASNGWDDDATGTTLIINADASITALATGTSTCEGSGKVTDVADFNIFLFDGTAMNTGVSLTNCGTRITNAGTPQQTFEEVDGDYDGMGVVVADEAGIENLVVILSSTLLKTPSMATYNEFIKN